MTTYLNSNSTQCSTCGQPIELNRTLNTTDRAPCDRCGGKSQTFNCVIQEEAQVYEQHQLKNKRKGQNRPTFELKIGMDLHRKSNQFRKFTRLIDREEDRYFEEIIDPETGATIRKCDQPLLEHRGHGNAKFKSLNSK